MKMLKNLKMEQVLYSPVVWVVAVVFVGFCLVKKQVKWLVLAASIALFFLLLSHTLPEASESISADKLIKFVGGTVALFAVDYYLIFVRDI